MARVIFCVDWTLWIRLRIALRDGTAYLPFFPLFGFFFFALFLFLVFGVLGRRRGWGGPPHRDPVQSAEADLARRFAAGEIDEKEYEQRIGTLRRLGRG